MMDDGDLDAIRERVNRASSGPWRAISGRYGPDVETDVTTFQGQVDSVVWRCDDPLDGCLESAAGWMADAEFLAATRDDVPRLLAEVDRLREENTALLPFVSLMACSPIHRNRLHGWYCTWCDGWCGDKSESLADFHHEKDCPVEQAKAFLAKLPKRETAKVEGEGE